MQTVYYVVLMLPFNFMEEMHMEFRDGFGLLFFLMRPLKKRYFQSNNVLYMIADTRTFLNALYYFFRKVYLNFQYVTFVIFLLTAKLSPRYVWKPIFKKNSYVHLALTSNSNIAIKTKDTKFTKYKN